MNRGFILHEDLTYAMLHEMVMKKFNLEAIYPLNLSAKVSSIDDNFDITNDHEDAAIALAVQDEFPLAYHVEATSVKVNRDLLSNGARVVLSTSQTHSNLENVRSNVLMKLQEALDEEAIFQEQILTLMHRFADRFTERRVEINNLMVLQDHPLFDYCKYALRCTTGADMKKCVYLKSVRDELLRSMKEKIIDDELQRHVKRLLLNTSLLTIFVVVCFCFEVF
nr:hypothetical protein [Tanacetum cinerariifolium]